MHAPLTNEAALSAYPYDGPAELQGRVRTALARVVDPELAMSITDLGLVIGVRVVPEQVQVRLTMTSAACPVAGLIEADVKDELGRVLPAGMQVTVELCLDPPWTPERMSARARLFMQG